MARKGQFDPFFVFILFILAAIFLVVVTNLPRFISSAKPLGGFQLFPYGTSYELPKESKVYTFFQEHPEYVFGYGEYSAPGSRYEKGYITAQSVVGNCSDIHLGKFRDGSFIDARQMINNKSWHDFPIGHDFGWPALCIETKWDKNGSQNIILWIREDKDKKRVFDFIDAHADAIKTLFEPN